ncbi:alcohol acetyltransferase [Penicillium longicatenatum]|uniref:alcohol acetyltransferase n=1 Tax=Penicillium longicatenatum TaxID=1561947 RepID=UPI002547E236|nr:alcohol acetyltransferase [Penicillium longicatenatum]KAJ5658544.1 alcohol acetyltransferase [Penicillium longicatenatum]
MRHALGFYGALTLSGLYTLHHPGNSFDASNIGNFIPALKYCIAAHPILAAAIHGEDTETPHFVRPAFLNLEKHIHLVDTVSPTGSYPLKDDLNILTQVNRDVHDQPFPNVDQTPPWKIVICPLATDTATGTQQLYIIFAYSHSHGDGKSGLAFHRSLLEGLQTAHELYDQSSIYQPPASPIPPPLEQACDLRITWSYLLFNLFGGHIPTSAWRVLGYPIPATTNTWTGKEMCYDPSNFRTGSEALLVNKSLLDATLRVCRKHEVRFTGFFNHLIVQILDTVLPQDVTRTFLGQIVVDLRPLIPVYTEKEMVNCVSALYETSSSPKILGAHERPTTSLKHDTAFWDAARRTTIRLADCASTLVNQPIGLLRYLTQFRPWFLEKLGKERESSYEISNVVNFDPLNEYVDTTLHVEHRKWDIERVAFSQPANVTGSALNFQVVTRKGGDMVITLNWQLGVLGVVDENEFVQDILARIHGSLTEMCCDCPVDCVDCSPKCLEAGSR